MNPQSRRMYPIISKNLVIHIMNIPRDRFIKIAKKLKSNRQKALKYSGYIMKYLVNSSYKLFWHFMRTLNLNVNDQFKFQIISYAYAEMSVL